MGTAIGDASVSWQMWPKAAISELMIVKSSGPNAMDDVKGSLTRDAFIRGEPMRRDKLVKGGAGGFMSAILPSGLRAVAIKVDNSGDDYAGGFILPNDRVDVIKIYRDDEATKARGVEVLGAQTILANVKVLAIGQNVQEENGKKVVVGGNATLELDPQQAEQVDSRRAGRQRQSASRPAQPRRQRRSGPDGRRQPGRRRIRPDDRAVRRAANGGAVTMRRRWPST